jgi:hypothetical protein
VLATGSFAASVAASSARRPWRGHPGRALVAYRVRRGDTATGLAVRFHAWTRELRGLNHLGGRARLRTGQRLRIPVVPAASRRHHQARRHHHRRKPRHRQSHPGRSHHRHHRSWHGTTASRAQVRRVVVGAARRHHVDPRLALAVAWQESGWQQHRSSSAGAIGVMQVLPGTGAWMSGYAHHRLDVYALRDNVEAGVLLLEVLRAHTTRRRAVAAYYQGLGSVHRHGLYPSTRRYTRSVLVLQRRLRRGWSPA